MIHQTLFAEALNSKSANVPQQLTLLVELRLLLKLLLALRQYSM